MPIDSSDTKTLRRGNALENHLGFVIYDAFPVTPLHALVIPKRHAADYFDLKQPEFNALNRLIDTHRASSLEMDPTILGFNIDVNCGEAAGQTIFHCHIHLIPRRLGDVPSPKGGVRHVIPGKGIYGST